MTTRTAEGDTWYAAPSRKMTARLGRPYENRGVPPHYKYYDQPFLQWLHQEKRAVDYLGADRCREVHRPIDWPRRTT